MDTMKNPEEFCKLVPMNFERKQDAEVYSCRFEKPRCGWAIIMFHEQTGTIAIHSDFGDWVYSWPSPGRGKCTLKDFFCNGSYDYMACKFEMGKKDIFHAENTRRKLLNLLKESRGDLENKKSKTFYRELHDEAEYGGSASDFYDSLSHELKHWLGGDWHENIAWDRRPTFYWLRDGILPALVTALRKGNEYALTDMKSITKDLEVC